MGLGMSLMGVGGDKNGGGSIFSLIPGFGMIKDIMQIAKSASSGMIASSVCLSCLIFGFFMVQIILKFV